MGVGEAGEGEGAGVARKGQGLGQHLQSVSRERKLYNHAGQEWVCKPDIAIANYLFTKQ